MHVYFFWSKLYRFIWERKNKKTELPQVTSLREVTVILDTSKWTADGPKELWDSIASAEASYFRLLTEGSLGDCDQSALVACKLIETLNIGDAYMMSVIWEKEGKLNGHNICLVKMKNPAVTTKPFFFMGNWFDGKIVGYYNNPREVAREVCKLTGDAILVSWFTYDSNLKNVLNYEIV
jgi:hypothetical protein